MPLAPDTPDLFPGDIARAPDPAAPPPRPAALDTLAAAFRQNNVASSLYDATQGERRPGRIAPGYDALTDVTGYEPFAERFITSDSPEETAFIKQRIDAETRDRQTLQAAGGWGLAASLAAGVTDPATVLSMALPVTAPTRVGRVAQMVGGQIAGDATTELFLQGQQELRTPTESVINVGAGAVLTGLLGTIASRVPRGEFEALRKQMSEELKPPMVVNPDVGAQSFGAAAVAATTKADETIATGGGIIADTLGKISPGQRLLTSPSVEARRLVQELSETPEMMAKNARGIATPAAIETHLKRLQGDWWQAYKARGELYGQYKARVRAEGGETLSRGEFAREVAYAMRRGDQSAIPEVAQAATRTRSLVFEPLKVRAIKAGLLPEDVQATGADSYLMRQYDTAKIRKDPRPWLDTVAEGFERQGIDRAEAEDIAYKVTRNILGSERGTLDLGVMDDIVPASGRLKERTLKLPDDVLEPWLVSDIDNLSMAYHRTLGPEVEITERFGDRDLKEALAKVKDEYGVLKSQAKAAGDDEALKRLIKREESDLKDLAAIRDRLYGHFGAPKNPESFFIRAGRFIRAVNYTRLLGGQVISAMTDTARLMMQHGAPKMMASAMQLATNLQAMNIGRLEARRMGIGLDLVLNTRGIQLGDVTEYSSFPEQAFMRKVSDAFSVASLQSPWNAVLKSWASIMSQDDVLKAASKLAAGGAPSKRMVTRLASIGLDEPMLARIAKQFEKHGQTESGLRFGNSDKWTDTAAARAYEAAIIKETDIGILTPGASDLPLAYSTEWGKALLQFKSFAMSSTRRLVVPAMQGIASGDLKTAQGMAALFGTGAAVYVLKQLAADQPITNDPVRFAMETVDKSGMLAWGGDVIFPSLWQAGFDDYSRWSDRKAVETLGGPVLGTTLGLYEDRLPHAALSGQLTARDVHTIRRLLPGQNLWYARRGINLLEEGAAEAIGAAP